LETTHDFRILALDARFRVSPTVNLDAVIRYPADTAEE
jgi:hypothetical protein